MNNCNLDLMKIQYADYILNFLFCFKDINYQLRLIKIVYEIVDVYPFCQQLLLILYILYLYIQLSLA